MINVFFLGYNLITIHVVEYIFSLKSKGIFLLGFMIPATNAEPILQRYTNGILFQILLAL
jgi:hypothetical protein